ncbi:MAG: PorT family protein [Flavobacteriaceae bacterium]|nr:PorT family protein [Flavobacteriaceae bacterium]
MKRLVLVAVLTTFCFTATQAQVEFGVKGGLNIANLNGDDADELDPNSRTSFNFGAVVGISVSDNFSVQPEVLFSGQGATVDSDEGEATFKLNYINVPVLASFEVTDGLSLQAGPQLGINIGDDLEFDGQSESTEAESIDFGAAFGAQYQLANGLLFQARYAVGLSDVYKEDGQEIDVKNGVLSFSIGYMFGGSGGDN